MRNTDNHTSTAQDLLDYAVEQSALGTQRDQAAECIRLFFEFLYEEAFAGRSIKFEGIGEFKPVPHYPIAIKWIDAWIVGESTDQVSESASDSFTHRRTVGPLSRWSVQ